MTLISGSVTLNFLSNQLTAKFGFLPILNNANLAGKSVFYLS
jgi:hypothetical protein